MFDGTVYFSLQDIFPPGHLLLWQPVGDFLIHFSMDTEGNPCIHGSQEVTDRELLVLLPLLQAYPSPCPYEEILARFHSPDRNITEELVAQTRAWLAEAAGTQAWEQQMEPVRAALARVRPKLQTLGIDIAAVSNAGYVLLSGQERNRRNL